MMVVTYGYLAETPRFVEAAMECVPVIGRPAIKDDACIISDAMDFTYRSGTEQEPRSDASPSHPCAAPFWI